MNNLQTEANKQIQNITTAGGGIENALSNFFALRRTGKVYTTRIYKYDTSASPTGVKLNDNEGLVRKPSTNTAIGQDDYREIGVFMHFPCNFTVDNKGFNHVTALQGQPDFKKTGKVDVGEVTMSAWVGITDNPEYVDYHYSDSPNEALGLVPMGESINPDGTISPFMVHGKYGAGDIDGVPYSSAGLILANGSQKGGKPVSHTGLIAYMRKKGSMYVGTTNWDLFYKQLMMIILYATTNSRSVMTGCNSYSMQEMAAVAETGVTRVILPKAKANNYIVGSYVSVGDIGSNTNKDRYYAYMHNLAYDVKILKIEPVDDTNSAIYLDTEPFNTTLTTCISTMPWRTGSTDSVLAKQLVPSLSVTSADIALSSYANKMDIERSLVDEIKKIDGVANAYGSSYVENIPATSSRAGIDHINIVSYDDTLLDYSKGSIAQGSLDTVYGNSNKVATVFNRNNSLHIGDTIQFAGEEVEITCALSQGLFGDDLIIICSQETFDRIMGDTKYGLIGIQLDSNATEETIAEIRSLENDDIIITDQREGNKQNSATYWAARIVCYGFLAIIGVISLFNIVNSISMSVSARIKQYGAMRAVGMDNRQLKRMISAEAYTYAISGLIVGCGIGLPLSRFLYNRLITHYFGIEWRFPILWFGIVVAFIFISAIVSVYAPAKRIRNMPITATINEL